MNALPTLHQNQFFNGPNAAQYQQQFSSTIGAVPNLPRPGELTNFSVGPTSLAAAGQSNVGQASFGSSSSHSYGQPPPAIDQRGMNAMQFRAVSVGEEGQSNAGFSSVRQCTTGQSYGQPPLAIDQRGMPRTQFSQSVQPTLGSEGQLNAGAAGQSGVGQALFGCFNGQSYGQPPQAIDQGGMRTMQLNPYDHTPSHRAEGQSVAGQAGLVWTNVQEKGCSGPCNSLNNPNPPPSTDQSAIYSTQFNPSVGHAPIGEAWQSNAINQDGKHQPAQFNSCNGPVPFTNTQLSTAQGTMHPSMQFNSSIGPTSLGPIGQSSTGQTPFRYSNMQEHMALGSWDSQSHGQPQTSGRGGRYSPMRFNRGRSFRGRNHYPRGRHFGSHGRPQNR